MLYVGTSGWSYGDWGKFYPLGLAARDQLPFLARHFASVELNASFYRLPTEAAFRRWATVTPPEFRFAVKVSRSITHTKRLNDVAELWQNLTGRGQLLGDKLGVWLLQFPPSLRATPEIFERLEAFLSYAAAPGVRLAFELRHKTWFEDEALDLFRRHGLCLVQAESSRYPHSPEGFSPAPFAYYRFHGPRQLYASQYTDEELDHWARLIRAELEAGKDVYAYFDNDYHGYALEDARRLGERLN
jgi:uncharacterized protein YecE (DUF72 family)